MFHTLYARLATVLVALFIAIGVAYALVSTSATRHYLQELTQRFNRDLARRIVADRNLVEEGRLNEEALRETFRTYMDINPSIEIYLLDTEGRILSYSADPGKVKRRHVDLEPVRAFLRGEGFPLLGDDPRSHDRRKAFSVTPVPSGLSPEGYLYVVLRGEEFDSVEQLVQGSYVLRLSAWAVLGSLGFGLMAGLLLFHLLTRRLQRLSAVMDGFQRSDFTVHLPYRGERQPNADEVDRLGATFERMAERITSQLSRLKEQDALRRELVAHISHDLRTPLASLQGYLETLQMKQGELAPDMRTEYLGIALRQSERLTGLVQGLFELARLEAKETRPRREVFPIAELLQDVAQKFRLKADEAGVHLDVETPPAVLFVTADIALTERVLDNLLGNAIDHTPAEGRVSISLASADGQVAVTVSDTGPGISAQDLPRIFEPFYRAGATAGEGGHAGLGLAIARRIVELQEGQLTVSSPPGGGSAFTFTLPGRTS